MRIYILPTVWEKCIINLARKTSFPAGKTMCVFAFFGYSKVGISDGENKQMRHSFALQAFIAVRIISLIEYFENTTYKSCKLYVMIFTHLFIYNMYKNFFIKIYLWFKILY